ncbi:hypothetical protein CHS0354_016312 [Potamilus streckersoni]|uniref:NTR domain-containing protein n=1 Tax=Potamilus streckersoni TaxID=2493646 RepID=A0AAE0VGL7_9BIVA|nr:hypothetical protein CHS0354_016312 [Potamilus streckersoni]
MRCVGAVFLLSLFCVIVQDMDACSCDYPEKSNRDKYCQADFGLKAYVKNETNSSSEHERVYWITTGVKRYPTLKGNFTDVDLTKVYTAFSSATCGVTLEPGKAYLLSGFFRNVISGNVLRIHLCGWTQKWRTLSQNDTCFVTSGYLTECSQKG